MSEAVNVSYFKLGDYTYQYQDAATQADLSNYVEKEAGKGLSSNDYSTEEKNKLAGIAVGATANIIDDHLSDLETATNAVQNKVITTELNRIKNDKVSKSDYATGSNAGVIKVGTGLFMDTDNFLNVNVNPYTLPIASNEILGGIKVGEGLSIDSETGVLSANGDGYDLPPATANTLGGIKVGQNLSITQDGTLSANASSSVNELDDLTDVTLTSPADGQVLVYDGTNDVWINSSVSIAEGIDDLDDVLLTNLTNGQILVYDGTAQKWKNEDLTAIPTDLEDLTDVTIISPSNGQILKYDSTNNIWFNDDNNGGVEAIELTQAQYDVLTSAQKNDPTKVYFIIDGDSEGLYLNELEDVILSNVENGQILIYDSTNEVWVNSTSLVENINDLSDVNITSASNSQILKYNSTSGKWENGTEYSYTLPIATESVLGGIQIGKYFSVDQNRCLTLEHGHTSQDSLSLSTTITPSFDVSTNAARFTITISKLHQYRTDYEDYRNCLFLNPHLTITELETDLGVTANPDLCVILTVEDIQDTGNNITATGVIYNINNLNIESITLKCNSDYLGTVITEEP